ncbi:MAG: FHA domain-containing protein [Lysobacterales bacterium]
MDRIIVQFLSGARAAQVEVYPVARFSSLYLGRDPKCDVRVDADRDTMVSRSHAVIEWVDQEDGSRDYTLTDLLSSNGTYRNGERVHGTVKVLSGDRVRLGHNGPEFLLTIEQPQPNLHAEVTQSLRTDQILRAPPPVNADPGNQTVRGPGAANLLSELERTRRDK